MMLAAMLVVLLVFTLLGMEIAWAIALACFAYIALSQLTDTPTAFALFAQQMTVGLDSFVLVSVPLFIFAGELMNVCGVTQRLVRVAAVIVGHMHGGLANVGVVANFLMSGCLGLGGRRRGGDRHGAGARDEAAPVPGGLLLRGDRRRGHGRADHPALDRVPAARLDHQRLGRASCSSPASCRAR